MTGGWSWWGGVGFRSLLLSDFVEPMLGDKGALRNPRHRSKRVFFKFPGNVFRDVPSVHFILRQIGVEGLGYLKQNSRSSRQCITSLS